MENPVQEQIAGNVSGATQVEPCSNWHALHLKDARWHQPATLRHSFTLQH